MVLGLEFGKYRNDIEILVHKDLKNNLIDVKKFENRDIVLEFILGKEALNVISVYSHKVVLDDQTKRKFWKNLDDIIQGMIRMV